MPPSLEGKQRFVGVSWRIFSTRHFSGPVMDAAQAAGHQSDIAAYQLKKVGGSYPIVQ